MDDLDRRMITSMYAAFLHAEASVHLSLVPGTKLIAVSTPNSQKGQLSRHIVGVSSLPPSDPPASSFRDKQLRVQPAQKQNYHTSTFWETITL